MQPVEEDDDDYPWDVRARKSWEEDAFERSVISERVEYRRWQKYKRSR